MRDFLKIAVGQINAPCPEKNELPNKLTWSLGGGTALSISRNHRISYDIDIFFQDASVFPKSALKYPEIVTLSSY